MKVNYFDFGLCGGEELHWMVNYYFPNEQRDIVSLIDIKLQEI